MKSRKRVWTSRVVKLLVAGIFLLWFVPFAHERITTPPARAPDDYSDLIAYYNRPQEGDATKEWIAALSALPVNPTFDEPPPAGMQWEFQRDGTAAPMLYDPSDMLVGEWDPASRPTLRVWIRFIGSEQTSAVLQRFTALRDRPWLPDLSLLAGASADVPPGVSPSSIRQAAKFFVGRSRYQREQRGDLPGAWEDLKTALLIVRTAPRDTFVSVLTNIACEALVLRELGHMAREVELADATARDVQRALRSLPSYQTVWTDAIRGELPYALHVIAGLYSDDGEGNGWLVMGGQPALNTWLGGLGAGPPVRVRSRLWNLLSPLYNDRRTVTAKVVALREAQARVADLSYAEAVEGSREIDARSCYGPLDGPHLEMLGTFDVGMVRIYQVLVRAAAMRRAARLMVALNRFQAENGTYPAALDQLVPEFLDALPTDPFCAGPFGYRLSREYGYVLYSCGFDGDDDGCPEPVSRSRSTEEDGDDVYTLPRSTSYTPEPAAVPLGTPASGEGAAEGIAP